MKKADRRRRRITMRRQKGMSDWLSMTRPTSRRIGKPGSESHTDSHESEISRTDDAVQLDSPAPSSLSSFSSCCCLSCASAAHSYAFPHVRREAVSSITRMLNTNA